MHRFGFAAGLLATFVLAAWGGAPSYAVTAKDKMATCKFGADSQKLAGKQRADFLKRCMSSQNDPRGPAAGGPGAPAAGAPADEPEPKI